MFHPLLVITTHVLGMAICISFCFFRLFVTFLGLWLSVGIPQSQIMLVTFGSKV